MFVLSFCGQMKTAILHSFLTNIIFHCDANTVDVNNDVRGKPFGG